MLPCGVMALPRRLASLCAGVFCVATMTWSAAALADDVAIAEKLFLEGRRLMEEGQYATACEKFKAAHDLDQAATGTLLNLALCHEQIKRNATAWAEFRQVVAESAGRREDRVTMARAHEAKIFPLLSFVTVEVPAAARVAGMRVELDKSRPIVEASWGVELPIDPGKHVIEVSAPGKVARSIDVEIGDVGDRKKVEIPVLADAASESAASPPPASTSSGGSQRTVGYVLGGVGIAALSAGAIFGVLAMSRSSDADDAASACPNDRCPTEAARSRAVDAIDQANTYANVANITVGAGAAMIIAGIVLVVTSKPESAASSLPAMFRVTSRSNGGAFTFGRTW
jgi:hypothetical protein